MRFEATYLSLDCPTKKALQIKAKIDRQFKRKVLLGMEQEKC